METERLNQLREMLNESPNDVFINYAIGLELYKHVDFSTAIQHMKSLAKNFPTYCPVHFKLGQWYAEMDQEEEALRWLNQALSIAEQENDNKAINEIREAIWLLT